MKRFRFSARRSARYGGVLATIAFIALTMFVVLPAFASTQGDKVPPVSGLGQVMPIDIGAGGNQTCTSQGLFQNMTGATPTTDPSPATGPWPSGAGWNFQLTVGATLGLPANKGQSLVVDSGGKAAILGIAIKGGTDNLTYDYRSTQQGWISKDTNLHAPAAAGKWTPGTNPEQNITQYYGISQLVICWKPLVSVSGKAYKDITGNPGIQGLTVTLNDTTTSQTQTTSTDASGNYTFSAIKGDNYTVCASNPAFPNAQTVPADQTGGACAPTNGYSITNLSANGQSGEDFGFQPKSSVGGRVYNDLSNPANGVYDAGSDGVDPGWKVTLYKNTVAPPGAPVWQQVDQQTSDPNGLYNFANELTPGGDYLVCERPPSGDATPWVESQPSPVTPNLCTSPDLGKGYRFTATASNVSGDDFGNVSGGITCPPQPIVGVNLDDGTLLQIQLAVCKPTQLFVFNSAAPGDPNYPWVSVFAGDQTMGKVPLIEKVVFPDKIVDGVPTLQHLAYNDTFPYDPGNTKQMPFCKLDPRDLTADPTGMTLASGFMDDSTKGSVLPNDIGTQTQATSCLISLRTYVDANGDGWLEGYAYTDIDGLTRGTN